MRTRISLAFEVGHSPSPNSTPSEWVPAVVPGAVQLDWARAKGMPDYRVAENYKAYKWMEDEAWFYRATLPEWGSERAYIVLGGVDYRFEVRVAGKTVHAQEGMFSPCCLSLEGIGNPGDELIVAIWPIPKRQGAPADDRKQADQSVKPAVSYGWDFHPRLVPLGLWEDAYLETRGTHIVAAETSARVSDDFTIGTVRLAAKLSAPATLEWKLIAPDGNTAFERVFRGGDVIAETVQVPNVALWWPNGHGAAALYTSELTLIGPAGEMLDIARSRVGFRTIELVQYPGAWQTPEEFPKTRTTPPITLRVNGRDIFAKGSNFVCPEIFPGAVTAETYQKHLSLVAAANMNILRVWGGAIVNKDAFFDMCDELGIMVWQEFPLACNNYVGTPEYLRVLDQESRSIILRLRDRACLAMWCGGNELYNGWSGMTEQSLALRLLNRNCFDLDPTRAFIPTSPLMGMAHGCYIFRYGDGREVFQVMPESAATAYTEFGVPAPANIDIIKQIIPEDELWPPKRYGAWQEHHAFGVWNTVTDTAWLYIDIIEDYFGPSQSLEQLIACGQWIQGEGYRCIFEESRRQKPRCSMALNWCLNEPWPTAANNSLLCYGAEPKAGFVDVAAACRPQLASARIPKFSFKGGESFSAELWLLNDRYEEMASLVVTATLMLDGTKLPLGVWNTLPIAPNHNLQGPTVRVELPKTGKSGAMTLLLSVEGRKDLSSAYQLLYKG